MSYTPSPDRDPPLPKTTLFCPNCGHGSPIDGDWRVDEGTEHVEYRCPDCERSITGREREDDDRRLARA